MRFHFDHRVNREIKDLLPILGTEVICDGEVIHVLDWSDIRLSIAVKYGESAADKIMMLEEE
jgi:hypothetical protein